MSRARLLPLLALAALLAALSAPALAAERPRFDTRVLALVPSPGFPAHAYVHPNRRVYEGTFVNPSGDSERSRVLEYTRRGTLLRSWVVPGQDLAAPHGVQVATSDSRGRLVLLDRTPPRAMLLDRRRSRFREYSSFADLPLCGSGETASCSQARADEPPMPNYAAWGRDGSLYVTDYLQAVIWRVAPGGGEAQVWLSDPRLDGNEFGTTGLELAADRRSLLIAQMSSAGLGDGNPTTGKLYSVPIGADGRPGEMRRLWESAPVDGPDGFGIARSGRLYIALLGSNQIGVLSAEGEELERFPTDPGGGENGSPVPFDNPSNASFLGRRIVVANQSAISGDPAHQAILDVKVGEKGLPELIPRRAGVRRD